MLEDLESENSEPTVYAEDTLLPKDLVETLQKEKQIREEVLVTRKKILGFFVGWTFHATGVAIAKWCLVLGGGSALWTAATLCFTISFIPSAFISTGISFNYTDGQFQANNMQNLGKLFTGIATASITSCLAIQEYKYLQNLSEQTIAEINNSIHEIQNQHPETSPWLTIAIAGVLFFGSMFAIFGRR